MFTHVIFCLVLCHSLDAHTTKNIQFACDKINRAGLGSQRMIVSMLMLMGVV